ncbi:hypothetical protein RE428_36040 [Marinobacter nanhaiticus D15-8W]|uniref:Uncharacterized protein n=1 Tax=Marinobacter nanhaiticus D15-8W TaxID=626887 RepID=N6X014_9GAMM|nr:hypothetical protein [Marinobacter nanhaiticus]ENO16772.1 hypothetical protein J057_03670 [Marinobacter nanhaiticus D15-8W]BES72586.1 hypothetical protein RE428_36040 [Marinobacter nanhaiticus D15-8W]
MKWREFFNFGSDSDSVSRRGETKLTAEHFEWTGPSVRVSDGEALLNSDQMKRDLEAAKKLSKANEKLAHS